MSDWSSLGLAPGDVILSDHQAIWKDLYEQEKLRLLAAIPDVFFIEHIGSTAIEALVAKPVLDIAIGLGAHIEGERLLPRMCSLGYDYLGEKGITGRYFFVLRKKAYSLIHLHMYQHDHANLLDNLVFRNHLRQHPEAIAAYSQLKKTLCLRYGKDRAAYTEAKSAFIQAILLQARQA